MGLELDFSNGERSFYDMSVSLSMRVDSRGMKILRSMSSTNALRVRRKSTTADRWNVGGQRTQTLEHAMQRLLQTFSTKITPAQSMKLFTAPKAVHRSWTDHFLYLTAVSDACGGADNLVLGKHCPLCGSISDNDDVVPTRHPSYVLFTASGGVVPVCTVYGD